MAGSKRTRGRCVYCQKELTRAGMAKHLVDCPVRTHAMAEASSGAGKPQPLYHLPAEPPY